MDRFFGYGSLVNTATHDFVGAQRARVSGWRRQWKHSSQRQVAFLSVRPDPQASIDGLVAQVPGGDWDALDAREHAYDRLPLAPESINHADNPGATIHMYRARPDQVADPSTGHPILLSYLDVVVQGYLGWFGKDGVQAFFDTTDGWDAPILNDRDAPQYPRHQELEPAETELVNSHLARIKARIVSD